MLPKSRRLSRKDFIKAKKLGKTYRFPHFSIIVHYQPTTYNLQPTTRFAVVTPASLSKKAVVRNRLRRRIYDSLSIINYQFSIDAIFYPRPSMLNLSREEINALVNTALPKNSP